MKKLICTGKILSILFFIALFLFIITFSVAIPIYFRPIYYAHIGPLNLSEQSGYTEGEIKEAFNDVMDYLTVPGNEFSTGVMNYTEEGKSHFADCKRLFNLNAIVLISSGVCLTLLIILKKKKKAKPFMLGKHTSSYYAAICAVVLPAFVGLFALFDFSGAFIIFHKIVFPGKTNWMFDVAADEIINVLPEEFFLNCAIVIGASIITFSAIILLSEKKRLKKEI